MSSISRTARPVKVSTPDLWDAQLDGPGTWDQDFDPKKTPGRWEPVYGVTLAGGEYWPTEGPADPEDLWDHPTDADRASYRQEWLAEFEEELDAFLNNMALDRDLAELSDRDDEPDPEGSVAHYEPFEPGDGPLSDRDIERATGCFG